MTPDDFAQTIQDIESEIGKVMVGQRELVRAVLIGLMCEGHVLLEGVPGLGKTLLLKTLGETLAVEFGRIQFTPDLMPADIWARTSSRTAASRFTRAPFSPTWFLQTRSTGRRRRRSPPCSKRCRNEG